MYASAPYKFEFRRVFRSLIKRAKPYGTVLDCACANGKFVNFFGDADYVGVDILPSRIDEAKDRYVDRDRASFYSGSLCDSPWLLAGRKFDLVVSTHTLAHIDGDNKLVAVRNLINSVERGGCMVLQLACSDYSVVLPLLREEMDVLAEVRYKGVFSRLFEKARARGVVSVNGRLSYLFWRSFAKIFSYFDVGKREETLFLLCRR